MHHWSYRQLRGLILSIALLLRVSLVALAGNKVPPTADGHFYHIVAQRIAEGHGYTWLWPDGAVTAAAHYPVGYPALISIPYLFLGYNPVWAMALNTLFGVLMTWSILELARLKLIHGDIQRAPQSLSPSNKKSLIAVGLIAALLPSFLFYVPALMTEGVVSALLLFALLVSEKVKGLPLNSGKAISWLFIGLLALVTATFLRPQSIALVPLFGFLMSQASLPQRILRSVYVTALVLFCCLPWVLRNCEEMGQCLFISANGGWNLLIGTFTEGQGAWVALEGQRVPAKCVHVFAEAAKDSCFMEAGIERIFSAPGQWFALIPDKLRTTFDYSNVAASHLKESGAIQGKAYLLLSAIEVITNRLLLLALLWRSLLVPKISFRFGREAQWLLFCVGCLGIFAIGVSVTILAIATGFLLCRELWRDDLLFAFLWCAGVSIFIHGVFFGAARYGLPLLAFALPNLVELKSLSLSRKLKGFVGAFDTKAPHG